MIYNEIFYVTIILSIETCDIHFFFPKNINKVIINILGKKLTLSHDLQNSSILYGLMKYQHTYSITLLQFYFKPIFNIICHSIFKKKY